MRWYPWFALAPLAAMATACGGADPSDLFSSPATPPEAGSPQDAATPDTGSAPVDAGAPPDAGSLRDVGAPEIVVIDAGSLDPGVTCGNAYCTAGTEICCLDPSIPSSTCAALTAATDCANGGGVPIECDDQTDCPGRVCCGTQQFGNYTYVRCQSSCNGTNEVRFCDPLLPVADQCASPFATCVPSALLLGYYVCQ
jgi:hypothetical protein